MTSVRWRVGRKVGRTLYRDGRLVGMMDTPDLARQVVEALNRTPLTHGPLPPPAEDEPFDSSICIPCQLGEHSECTHRSERPCRCAHEGGS